MTQDVSSLQEAHEYLGKNSIIIENGLSLPIAHIGIAYIPFVNGIIKLKHHCVCLALRWTRYLYFLYLMIIM